MGESFIKKAIFIVLLAVLAIVWGRNIYQMITAGSDIYYKDVIDNVQKGRSALVLKKNQIQLPEVNYSGDPFEPFFMRKIERPINSITKIDIKDRKIPPDIHFLGLIKKEESKYAIIELGGNTSEIVQIGDEINDIKILDFDDDSLKCRYDKKIHKIAIGQ
jgi:hypothetical protein